MIVVALGANLPSRFGSPLETLRAARQAMQNAGVRVVSSSGVWLTAPVPLSDQPWYHNAVVRVETSLSPWALLETVQAIENEFGRVRSVRNAPRVIDIDLIAYNGSILDKPELIVPHPRMHQRAFVLLPLREVAEGWTHPVSGATLDELIVNLPPGQDAVRMDAGEGVL